MFGEPALPDSICCKANGYRLPTEAEWEYCARGGENHLYSGSNNIDEIAWYGGFIYKDGKWVNTGKGNSGKISHPVGEKKANGYGLYDMSGNVYEWVWDTYSEYKRCDVTDPYTDKSSPYRIFRGGSWNYVASYTRVSFRHRDFASYRYDDLGFRFLRTV